MMCLFECEPALLLRISVESMPYNQGKMLHSRNFCLETVHSTGKQSVVDSICV